MVVNESGKFLNVSEHKFKGRDGSDVTFYKLGFIPESDHKPIELVCTKDVHDAGMYLNAYDDVTLALDVYDNRGYIKVRVTFLGVPA